MKIFIATDHRGVDIEKELVDYLKTMNVEVITTKLEHHDTDDYPDFAYDVCQNVINNTDSLGILICGTGIGMSIAANKVKGIRAAKCCSTDEAYYAKFHNAANVLCLSMSTPLEKMCEIIDTFINTKNAEDERHLRRIEKIIKIESGTYNEL